LPWLLLAEMLALSGCSRPVGPGALVITQSPLNAGSVSTLDILDSKFSAGSRLILVDAASHQQRVRVLSHGLVAAANPVISYDGRRVIFSARKSPDDAWQIYETRISGGAPKAITSMPGGAMQPALLSDDRIVFVSPVPKSGRPDSNRAQQPQLFVTVSRSAPRQLTFCPTGATDPTVLSDGRILFVSRHPAVDTEPGVGQALYTINNDGTELTPFAGQHEPASLIGRPRQLADGRVGFVSGPLQGGAWAPETAEFVRMARPFFGWEELFPKAGGRVLSVQPVINGDLLVCVKSSPTAPLAGCSYAVFRISRQGSAGSANQAEPTMAWCDRNFTPVFGDPSWRVLEAVEPGPHARPLGRLSNMDLAKRTGQILCLNANDTTLDRAADGTQPVAATIRVLAAGSGGAVRVLGEVPLQADGSFMAEVPSDLPLGFEALDQSRRVLRRVSPIVWVRPGENRSCIGCHEPHNHTPHNQRPLAVRVPVPLLDGTKSGSRLEISRQ
jgi:Hydrazine synthase alpha subunit middle domain